MDVALCECGTCIYTYPYIGFWADCRLNRGPLVYTRAGAVRLSTTGPYLHASISVLRLASIILGVPGCVGRFGFLVIAEADEQVAPSNSHNYCDGNTCNQRCPYRLSTWKLDSKVMSGRLRQCFEGHSPTYMPVWLSLSPEEDAAAEDEAVASSSLRR